MIKRASTILLTLFLLLTSAQVWGVTMTSSTTFQKKDGVAGNVYKLEDIKITPPFIDNIKTTYTYNSSSASGKSNNYSVSSSGAYFGYKKTQPKNTFITIPFTNLTIGKTYTFKITFKIDAPRESGDGMEFNIGYSGINKTKPNISGNAEDGDNGTRVKFRSYNDNVTLTYSFKASENSGSYSIAWNWDDKEKIKGVIVSSISMSGDLQPTVLSVAGSEICKGEENTYTAVGIYEPLTWEYSTDNKATWKKLTNKTTSSITAELQDDTFIVRARNGSNSVESNEITTFICCSKTSENKDKHIIVYEEYFNLTNGQRRPLDNNARSQYPYSNSGHIGGDKSDKQAEYAIVHKASDGGYWQSAPVRQGNTVEKPGESDNNDGFLLVNCGKEKQDFFYYIVQRGNLCSESLYDFSVDITNVDNTAGQAPVNAIILVHGQKNGTLSSQPLLKIETGNLESGHDWETFTRSFNSDKYNEFRISVRNNYQGTETDVKGNDIGLDNIVFRTCAPEIQIYSPKEDGSLEYEEVVLECDRTITLEAIASYDLTEFFSTPYYLFQISKDKITWNNVGSVQTDPTVSVTVDDTYLNGFYYQVWVGADPTEVTKSARDQKQGTGCGALTAVSEPISVKYECPNPCTATAAPSVSTYDQCPVVGTKEYYSLLESPITTDKNNYEWEKYNADGTTTTPITAAAFDTNDTNNSGKYRVRSKKFTDASGVEHCLSPWKDFTITISESTGILLIVDGEEYGPSSTYTICAGKEVTLKTSYEPNPTNSEYVKWEEEVDGATVIRTETTSSITVTPEKDTKYTATIVNSCKLPGSITVKVISLEKPIIGVNKNTICKGTAVNMGVSYVTPTTPDDIEAPTVSTRNTTTTTYTWYFSESNTSDVSTWTKLSCTNADMLEYAPEKTGYYKLKANIGECSEISDAIKVTVGEPIEFKVKAVPETICANSESGAKIIMSDYLNTATIQWYKGTDTSEEGTKVGDEDGLASVAVYPTTTTTYTASVKDVCEATKSVTVTVDAAINATYPEDQTICIGEQATLVATGGTKYTWSGSNGYNKENTTGKITVSPEDVGDIIYSVKIEKGKCSATGKSTVSVKALPKINSIIVTTNEEHKRDIALNIESEVDYEVSLDDETYGVPDIILQNVPIGWNLLYVKDENSCKNSEEFYVEPIDIFPDKFFTPNGDGVNDKWEVLNLDLYSSYIVEIFDRHGKRLFIQRVGSFNTGEADVNGDEFKGWEGIYNGHQMPSDDYWYLITVEEIRKQYTGHFTLKR